MRFLSGALIFCGLITCINCTDDHDGAHPDAGASDSSVEQRLYTACDSDSDCGGDQECLLGACTMDCQQADDGAFHCPEPDATVVVGATCYLDRPDEGWCRAKCFSKSDCQTGLDCFENVCTAESP
jgi:hypothetical protein